MSTKHISLFERTRDANTSRVPAPAPIGVLHSASGGDPGDDRDRARNRRRVAAAGISTTLLMAMLASFILQVGPVAYLVQWVPPPPRPTMNDLMNRRIAFAMIEEIPPEEEQPEEPEEENVVDPEPEPAPDPEPEPESEPEPEPEPEPENIVREEDREPLPEQQPAPEIEGGSGLAGLGASDSGTGPAINDAPPRGSDAVPRTERREERRAERDRERRRPVRLEDTSTPPRRVEGVGRRLGYPREFREAGVTGLVVLRCIVTESGRVRACRRRSGPEELAEYAEAVVRTWRFEPGRDHEGDPVPVAQTFRFPFRLR